MGISPDNLHFRVSNKQTGCLAYYNGLAMPSSLEPSDHIEFMSSLTDRYGKIIYDGDIVRDLITDIPYIVEVDFQHGTMLKRLSHSKGEIVESLFNMEHFLLKERSLDVIDRAKGNLIKEVQNEK